MAKKKYTKTHAKKDSVDAAITHLEDLINKFNALLAKLDANANIAETDFRSTLAKTVKPSEEIR